jgi:hypothetical protein
LLGRTPCMLWKLPIWRSKIQSVWQLQNYIFYIFQPNSLGWCKRGSDTRCGRNGGTKSGQLQNYMYISQPNSLGRQLMGSDVP